jgi:hypothetical protein
LNSQPHLQAAVLCPKQKTVVYQSGRAEATAGAFCTAGRLCVNQHDRQEDKEGAEEEGGQEGKSRTFEIHSQDHGVNPRDLPEIILDVWQTKFGDCTIIYILNRK